MKELIAAARIAITALGLLITQSHPASPQSADGLGGKTIRLYIGTGPGGGYDIYGRLVARHIGRQLPGHPPVVPQNMPGASSLTLTNFLFNQAPRDGTAIGIINQAMPTEQYLLDQTARHCAGSARDENRFAC